MSTQICIFNPTTNLIDVITGTSTFTGSTSDAGKPVVLNANGALDSSFTGNPILAVAAVNLAAGQLVNVYNNAGVVTARLANAASASSFAAHGFVTSAVTAGTAVNVFTQGLVNIPYTSGFSNSDVGAPAYLSNTTAGFITKTVPTAPDLIQPLGFIYQVGLSPSALITLFFLPNPLASEYSPSFATTSGTCAVGQGGTGANLSGTGGAHQVLKQSTVGGIITVGQLAFTDISGILGVAVGGTGVNLSATGGTSQVLKQTTVGGTITVAQLAFTDISGTLALTKGGTGADLSATGGAHEVLMQTTLGGVVTVAQLASSDLSDASTLVTGSGSTTGYLPLFSGTNALGNSHIDDGITTAGVITSIEPIAAPYYLPQIIYAASGTPLPAAGAPLLGATAIVGDATAPTYMAAYTSGGSITCQVICSIDLFASPPVYAWLTK
jgi:hypothetical protein